MKIASLPQQVMARLLQLESDARAAQSKASDAAAALANARKSLNSDRDPDVLVRLQTTDIPRLLVEAETASNAHSSLSSTAERCRRWLDTLPDSTCLELYSPQITEGDPAQALHETEKRLTATTKERDQLRRIPTPSDDIEARVRDYVAHLAERARPYVRGVSKGEKLSIKWPPLADSSTTNTIVWPDNTCNPLLMAALLHPDELAQRILDEIARENNEVMPAAEREQRIVTLTSEIEELQRQASDLTYALVQNGDARTYGNAPPAAVLGVIIAQERQAA